MGIPIFTRASTVVELPKKVSESWNEMDVINK